MTDVRGARIVRLIEDPAVGGDLLLVAVALAARYDFGLAGGGTLVDLGGLLWSDRPDPGWKVRETFRRDIRTFKPPRPGRWVCTAPMVRRAGTCGKSAMSSGYLTDWATGEKRPAGGCARHREWFEVQHRANWAAKPENPPLPCANHGGALVPHFPRIDWRKFWRRLDPSWVEHPEVKPWPKPDLTLILGDASGASSGAVPILAAVGGPVSPDGGGNDE